jgi:hypothetical protein
VKTTDNLASFPALISKGQSSWANGDWHIVGFSGGGAIFRILTAGGAAAGSVSVVTNGGNLSDGNWHFLFCWVDSVNQTVNARLDGFAAASSAFVQTPGAGNNPFIMGDIGSLDEPYTGLIDAVAFGKSPPGGIAAVAATIRDALWNGGAGVDLSTISSTNKTAWGAISAWPLNEGPGQQRNDIWGTNHLTDTNTVVVDDGKVEDYFQNGLKCLRFDQRNQGGNGTRLSNAFAVNQPFDVYMAFRPNVLDALQRMWLFGPLQFGQGASGPDFMYAGNLLLTQSGVRNLWKVHSMHWEGASSTWRLDGAAPAGGVNIGNFGLSPGLDLGHNNSTMDVEEIWITTPLSAADRQYMEGYLAWLIGTQSNLPPSHPYFSSPPSLPPVADWDSGGVRVSGAGIVTIGGSYRIAAMDTWRPILVMDTWKPTITQDTFTPTRQGG